MLRPPLVREQQVADEKEDQWLDRLPLLHLPPRRWPPLVAASPSPVSPSLIRWPNGREGCPQSAEQVVVGSRAGVPDLRRVRALLNGRQQRWPLHTVGRIKVQEVQHVPRRAARGDHPSYRRRSRPASRLGGRDLLKEVTPTDRARVGGWPQTPVRSQSGKTPAR
jgi:hypothetical protein